MDLYKYSATLKLLSSDKATTMLLKSLRYYTILFTVSCFSSLLLADDMEDLLALPLDKLIKLKFTSTSFIPETYLDASSSATLMTSEMWSQRGDRMFNDTLKHLPSTMVYPYLASGSIAIRGYATNASVRGNTLIFNGIPLNGLSFGTAQYELPNLQLATLDSIETVRGGASSLYGADAFHGVISLNPYNSKDDSLRFSGTYSSNNFYQQSMNLSEGLGENIRFHFAYGLSGRGNQDKHYTYGNPDGSQTVESARLIDSYNSHSILARLSSEHQNSWNYNLTVLSDRHQRDEATGLGRLFLGGTNVLEDRNLFSTETDFNLISLSFNKNYSEYTRLNIKSYYWESQLMHNAFLPKNVYQPTFTDENRLGFIASYSTYSEKMNSHFSLMLSADEIEITKRRQQVINPLAQHTIINTILDGEGNYRKNQGLAFQGKSYFFDEQLIFNYGVRFDRFSDVDNYVSPRGGVIYKLSTDQVLKFLYGNAYRPPTTVEIRGIGLAKGNDALSPETIDNFELIYLIEKPHYRIELSAYHSLWADGIVQAPCVSECFANGRPTVTRYENVSENNSRGVEFTLTGASDLLQYYFSASYNISKSVTNNQYYSAFPRFIINFDLGYNFESIDSQVYLANRLHLKTNEAPSIDSMPISKELPTYFRSDLQLSKQLSKQFLIKIAVRNLFNRENYLPSITNSENGVPDEPRSVALSVDYQF